MRIFNMMVILFWGFFVVVFVCLVLGFGFLFCFVFTQRQFYQNLKKNPMVASNQYWLLPEGDREKGERKSHVFGVKLTWSSAV